MYSKLGSMEAHINHQSRLYWKNPKTIAVYPPIKLSVGDCRWGMFKISYSPCSNLEKHSSGYNRELPLRPTETKRTYFIASVTKGESLSSITNTDNKLEELVQLLVKSEYESENIVMPLKYKQIVQTNAPYTPSMFINYNPDTVRILVAKNTKKGINDFVEIEAIIGNAQDIKKRARFACDVYIHSLRVDYEKLTITPYLHTSHVMVDDTEAVPSRFVEKGNAKRNDNKFLSIGKLPFLDGISSV